MYVYVKSFSYLFLFESDISFRLLHQLGLNGRDAQFRVSHASQSLRVQATRKEVLKVKMFETCFLFAMWNHVVRIIGL